YLNMGMHARPSSSWSITSATAAGMPPAELATRSKRLRLPAMPSRSSWFISGRRSASRPPLLRVVDREHLDLGRDRPFTHDNFELLPLLGKPGLEDSDPNLAEARALGRARQRP